jgi:dTMP kinase
MKSLFITFEGGEGAGKTTLIGNLERHLISQGYDVVRTREPGGSQLSETIRKWVLEHNTCKISSLSELLLFLAARAQHIDELIAPALKEGKIVLCDRFNDSTIAYQGVARGLGVEKVKSLCELVTGDYQPQLTIYLDVDPKEGLNRSRLTNKDISKTGQLDKMESEALAFHEKVRNGFLMLAKNSPERITVINANEGINKVFDTALSIVEPLLPGKSHV